MRHDIRYGMNAIKCILSLTTSDNDYQQEQAVAAQEAAARFGVKLTIVYAKNDAIAQGQQLLEAIQSRTPPDLILCQAVGTEMVQVANAAVSAKIGWILLNRDAAYVAELRRAPGVPVFKCCVYICSLFIPHAKTTKLIQPCESTFHNPAS